MSNLNITFYQLNYLIVSHFNRNKMTVPLIVICSTSSGLYFRHVKAKNKYFINTTAWSCNGIKVLQFHRNKNISDKYRPPTDP